MHYYYVHNATTLILSHMGIKVALQSVNELGFIILSSDDAKVVGAKTQSIV